MDKVVRNGRVAVLISPSYGCGWYTENHKEQMLFDPELVKMVEEKATYGAFKKYLKQAYPTYIVDGALQGLEIVWIPEGKLFRVQEYDGSESIVMFEQEDLIQA
jgi:hypothetical protein